MKRCMGCMELLPEGETVCLQCGYAEGTPARETYHLNPGTILGGRYIAGRVLGFGGFGVTYIGWDEQLQRKLAVKEFLPSSFATRMPGFTQVSVFGGEATEQFHAGLQRFVDEAMRLAKFNGIPGIVDIYDTFVENSTAYIVMEYLQGRDVKQKLEEDGIFSYEDAREIILKVCETLRVVHREGLIHRDISPDNIYLTDSGEVKLLDFGASRYATSINSKSLSVILKAGYAPEEQYRSRGDQGAWSDVYALSATFYKMITGTTPLDSMERAIRDELEEPSKLGIVLPKPGETAILNALNVRKENRTKTVEEFALQLNSDGVERVKEKARRNDSGGLPLWGKVLIGGSLGLTLVFSLLTVTGVVDLGQGNLLKDQFGPAVEDGYVNAPGIVNLMEQEAQNQVKKTGLDYLITGKEYSDSIAKGKILSQTPLPGRVMALGEKIEVMVSGGSRQDAIQAGEMVMPDLSFMDIRDAIFAMEEQGFTYNTGYEFSDTVAEGLVTRYEPYKSGNGARIYVSAGRKGQKGSYGELRAPFYDPGEGTLIFASTVEQKLENSVIHKVEYSLDDGNTWSYFKDLRGRDYMAYFVYYLNNGDNPIADESINITKLVAMANPDLSGKEMKLKLVRYNPQGNDSVMDSLEVPGTFVAEAEPWDFTVSGITPLTWDEIEEMKERGELPENEFISRILEQEERMKNEIPIRLTGDFKENFYYSLIQNANELGYTPWFVRCFENGVLYETVTTYSVQQMESDTTNWYVAEEPRGRMEEKHKAAAKMKVPVGLTIKNWEFQEGGSGKPFLEAAYPYIKSEHNEIAFAQSSLEPGTLIRENLEYSKSFVISAGDPTKKPDPKQIMVSVLWPEQYGQILAGCVYVVEDQWNYDDWWAEYSTDGGKNFQPFINKEGQQAFLSPYEGGDLKRIGGEEASILFQERTDLWEKELVLGIQGPVNRSWSKETLFITGDHPAVGVTGLRELEMSELGDLQSQGRLPDHGVVFNAYDRYLRTNEVDNRVFILDGNFQTGCTYYLMPGGTRYGNWRFECVQDGELLFRLPEQSDLTEDVRNKFRNTVIQSVNYEYLPDKGQLVAHVSPMAMVDMEKILDN